MWAVIKTVLAWLAGFVIEYLRGGKDTRALEERTAELEVERERVRRLEEAAAAERAARLREVDAEIAAADGADDAARVLRDVTGANQPEGK